MQSVGHQLMKARKARNLSIEDVAFETRIPHQRLRDMENDDLSNFANLTYAKGFLKLYSRHLNLDLHDYLDEFDTSVIAEAAGHEWSRTANIVGTLSPPSISPDQPRNPASYALMAAAALVVGGIVWIFLKPHVNPESTGRASSTVATVSSASKTARPAASPDPARSAADSGSAPASDDAPGTLARASTSPAPLPVVESFPQSAPASASPPTVPAASEAETETEAERDSTTNPPPAVVPPLEPGSSIRRATIVDDQGNEVAR